MSHAEPLVTIGIPSFNRARWIGRAIASALNQDYRNIEVIVSDNCSTDDTGSICQDCERQDARVRYIRQPRNIGATANFDEVFRQASGHYFMWLGDDDWIDPNYVSVMLAVFQADPSVSLASGVPVYYRNGTREGTGKTFSAVSGNRFVRVLSYYWSVDDNGGFYGLMRTASTRHLRPRNVMGGDWIFVANLAAMGKLVMSTQACVHRELGGATTSYENIAKTLGVSTLHARFPFSSIATSAFADIAHLSETYRAEPWWARSSMAVAVFLCIALKACYLHTRKWVYRLVFVHRKQA